MYAGSKYYAKDREKRKEWQGALADKKNAEKRDKWIKELEARDREDNEARERRQALATSLRENEKNGTEGPVNK